MLDIWSSRFKTGYPLFQFLSGHDDNVHTHCPILTSPPFLQTNQASRSYCHPSASCGVPLSVPARSTPQVCHLLWGSGISSYPGVRGLFTFLFFLALVFSFILNFLRSVSTNMYVALEESLIFLTTNKMSMKTYQPNFMITSPNSIIMSISKIQILRSIGSF